MEGTSPPHATLESSPGQTTDHTDKRVKPDNQVPPDAPLAFQLEPKPPITTLPLELLLEIIGYLPFKSKAALALADRGFMNNHLGPVLLEMDPNNDIDDLIDFLSHTDRCSVPNCGRCLALQQATPCTPTSSPAGSRCYGPLPPFDTVQAIMSAFRLGNDYKALLNQDFSHYTGFHESETGIKPTFNKAAIRLNRGPGRVIWKVETGLKPQQVRKLVFDQLLPDICVHTSWLDEYPFLSLGKSTMSSTSCRTRMNADFCFWNWLESRDSPCTTLQPRSTLRGFISHPESVPSPHRRRGLSDREKGNFFSLFGYAHRCEYCLTEFSLNIVPRFDDPNKRRLVVFTIWKNLGSCAEDVPEPVDLWRSSSADLSLLETLGHSFVSRYASKQ